MTTTIHPQSILDSRLPQALERAYLRPEMQAAVLGLENLSLELSERVIQVDELPLTPGLRGLPLPEASLDVLFADPELLTGASEPLAAVQELAQLLRPGGRLLLVASENHPAAGQVRGWLEQAGLVNRLLFDRQGKPARTDNDLIQLAVGTRMVADVHAAVRQGYGNRAAGRPDDSLATTPDSPASGSCCAPGGCDCTSSGVVSLADIGYTPMQLQDAPPEAAEIALGCGNPTAFAGLRAGEVVLDVGSGGGLDSLLAAKAVGPTGQVIGVDMTPAMLERARRAAANAGVTWAEYRQGQAEALPVDGDSVDVTLSNCVINLAPDKGVVFDEIFRVLKPGGRLEISDIVAAGSLPAALGADPSQWAGCVAGALPEGEYVGLVEQAGFTDIRLQRSPAGETYGGVPVYSLAVSARKPLLA